jgi:exopolyphosphatase/guanosine-5'-triphosphate,3'-diphosphate pyrophosphatase
MVGNTERIWLLAAALLHDISKTENPKKHHKLACRIIVNASELPFRREERVIIGLIARYHRGPLPHNYHKYYRNLDAETRLYIRKLAALLRLADGLDKGHIDLVEDVQCDIRRKHILIDIISRDVSAVSHAMRKADLFAEVFDRRAVLQIKMVPQLLDRDVDPEPDSLYIGVN